MPRDSRQWLGKTGEDHACAALEAGGSEILARRYRTRHGEIDIVACDGAVVVFVEVKARTTDRFGGAAAAVTRSKQHRMGQMAVHFLARHRLHDRPCRFDVVTVEFNGGSPRVEIYRNAFGLS